MPVRTLWTVLPHLRDKSERGLAEPRLIPTQPSKKKNQPGQSRPVKASQPQVFPRLAGALPWESQPKIRLLVQLSLLSCTYIPPLLPFPNKGR